MREEYNNKSTQNRWIWVKHTKGYLKGFYLLCVSDKNKVQKNNRYLCQEVLIVTQDIVSWLYIGQSQVHFKAG